MRNHRSHALLLMLLLSVVALAAQLAGVGARRGPITPPVKAGGTRSLATIPGGAVPDVGSTMLARRAGDVKSGEVVTMKGVARIAVRSAGAAKVTQVVCGLRYSRDGDASWSLGTPYETVVIASGKRDRISIERSFAAPATDRYQVRTVCHVATPASGARVFAVGTASMKTGLPAGAAIPVS